MRSFPVMAAVVGLALGAPVAQAQGGDEPTYAAPPGTSGLDQYSESIPTAGGNTGSGDAAPPAGGPLTSAQGEPPPSARGGATAQRFESFTQATAPRRSVPPPKTRRDRQGNDASPARPKIEAAPEASLPRALLGDVVDGGMGSLLPLLLGSVALGGIAYAGLRHRLRV